MNQFALGVRTSIYNGLMREKRHIKGLSQKDLSELVDCPIATIGDIETFKKYPDGDKLDNIATELDSTLEEMFPEWLVEQRIKKSSTDTIVMVEKLQLESPEVKQLESGYSIEEDIDKEIMKGAVLEALQLISERERKILSMRFGVGGQEPHTLSETAQEWGVSRERIRQMEQKALGRIRNSKEAKELKEFLV